MRTTVIIQDLKCDHCRPVVLKAFKEFDGISNVVVNAVIGSLSFDYKSHNILEGLRIYLSQINHPITDDPTLIFKG